MPDTMMTTEPTKPRNRSAEIHELAAALVKAQAAMKGAKKDAQNPHFKNNYADLESVWDAIREPLTANGLCVVQMPQTVENGVEIETILLHSSGQYLIDCLWLPVSKQDAQGIGSAITYGRRYALMSMAGVAPVDDDGNAAAAAAPPNGMQRRAAGPSSNWVNDAQRDGTLDTTRAKGTLPGKAANGKKTAAEKTRDFIDDAIQFLNNLSPPTVDAISRYQSFNGEKLDWIRENFPAEYDRYATALDAASEAARALVPA